MLFTITFLFTFCTLHQAFPLEMGNKTSKTEQCLQRYEQQYLDCIRDIGDDARKDQKTVRVHRFGGKNKLHFAECINQFQEKIEVCRYKDTVIYRFRV